MFTGNEAERVSEEQAERSYAKFVPRFIMLLT